jgi:PAS domain S-box-containing protein
MHAIESETVEMRMPAAKAPGPGVSVLLVDDEVRNLNVLESILEPLELRLIRATTPDDALLALVHEDFACIVLDIQMPSMSGLDLARLIKTRKRCQNVPIIFLTAYFLEEKDILQGYGAGAVDYLTKPINPQILKSKVGVFVDLFRTTRALAASNRALEEEIMQRRSAQEALREANNALELRVQERTEELSLSEQRYRQLIRNLPAAIYSTDADGRITFYNDSAVELWGREPEVSRDYWCGSHRIMRPDGSDLALEDCPLAVTLRTGVPVRGQEIVIERPDGTRRNVLPYPTPIHDVNGRVVGAVNMLLDVTERNLAQMVSQRLAAIVESSDDAIIGKDTNGIINSWNRGAERIFQYKAAEIIGKPVLTLIPPERRDEEAEILSRIRAGDRVKHFETIRRRKDGTLIDVALTISPVKDANGKIIGASKIARNITDRKRNERQQQAMYALVAKLNRSLSLNDTCEAALDAVFQCHDCDRASILLGDAGGVMRFQAWRGLSDGYRAAVEGHSPWKPGENPQPIFINDLAVTPLVENIKTAVEKERIRALAFIPIVYEDRLFGKFMLYYNAPHEFSFEEMRPVRTIASQIAFAIERDRSMRELRQAHDDMLKASRAKDEFLATLSHELRTPLNPVLLIASDAARDHDLPPRVRTDFDTIRKNVEMEARLIDDLLDLTRIARGKVKLDRHNVSLRAVLEDAIGQVCEEMNEKKIEFFANLDGVQEQIYADAIRLQQIFWNLLKNAVKFTGPGGRISVNTAVTAGKAIVRVSDTGIGMTPDEMSIIFNAFAQGHQPASGCAHRFGGLGLGLAISQKLAELHRGKIHAASEGRGKGATFTVELPLISVPERHHGPDQAAPEQPPQAPANIHGLRVLLVEDHEPTRLALTQLLLRRHYKVTAAGSLKEALAAAEAGDFHLVISDIGLPDGSGYELMNELRNRTEIPGIALTGYGMDHDVARSEQVGFGAHLTKPVRVETLDRALAAVLNGRAAPSVREG